MVEDRDFRPRNTGLDALLLQSVPKPSSLIPAVGKHPLRFGQHIKQGGCAGIVADLTSGYAEAEWSAIGIDQGRQLCIHPTFRASD